MCKQATGHTPADGLPQLSEEVLKSLSPEAASLIGVLLQMVEERDRRIAELERQVMDLRRRLNKNSTNSNQPPSKDPPWRGRGKDKSSVKTTPAASPEAKSDGERKDSPKQSDPKADDGEKNSGGTDRRPARHPGVRQQMVTPDKTVECPPEPGCSCGWQGAFDDVSTRHTHQFIDMLPIMLQVIHFCVQQGRCPQCGRIHKGRIPVGYESGYGPLLTAFVVMLTSLDMTRRKTCELLQDPRLFRSADGSPLPISQGGIQNIVDRGSAALEPIYEELANGARQAPINHVDETSWPGFGPLGTILNWAWVMVSSLIVFIKIQPGRSRRDFEDLIGGWAGYLISDGYALYKKWTDRGMGRQTCLAHLLRAAKKLMADPDATVAACGRWVHGELKRLAHMKKEPPTVGGILLAWPGRMTRLIRKYRDDGAPSGTLCRRLESEMACLHLFLHVAEMEPTNNRAEQELRALVVHRQVSYGSTAIKGRRFIERIFSIKGTCRIHGWSYFGVILDAVQAHFNRNQPDLTRFRELTERCRIESQKMGVPVAA